MIDQLIEDSRRHITAMQSHALRDLKPAAGDAEEMLAFVKGHPDSASYHLLIALRRLHRPEYDQIAPSLRAAVLADALATLTFLNDWGYLDPKEPYDAESAQAMIDSGPAAVPALLPLLNNRHAAPLFGSEEATMSSMYAYRRSDFAYRYLCLILGRVPVFDANPDVRDKASTALAAELTGK